MKGWVRSVDRVTRGVVVLKECVMSGIERAYHPSKSGVNSIERTHVHTINSLSMVPWATIETKKKRRRRKSKSVSCRFLWIASA